MTPAVEREGSALTARGPPGPVDVVVLLDPARPAQLAPIADEALPERERHVPIDTPQHEQPDDGPRTDQPDAGIPEDERRDQGDHRGQGCQPARRRWDRQRW